MTTTIELRPSVAGDRDFLLEVYASTRAGELAIVPWTDEQKAAFVLMQFEAQDTHYHGHMPEARYDVVLVGGERAGRLYVDRRADAIHVVDIALLPAFRGAGVGGQLLRELLDESDATGRKVSINVEHTNPARRLYERLGFVAVPESADDVYVLMEREPHEPSDGSTRRQVLQAGAAGGVALWLVGGPSVPKALAGAGSPDLTWLRRSAYAGLAGRTLTVGGKALRLDAVSDLAHAADRGLAGSDEAFALRLSGSGAGAPLEQGIHAFRMPGGGGADLFIAPVDGAADRQAYEVVVDRSVRLASVEVPSPAKDAAPVTVTTTAPVAAAATAAAPAAAKGAADPEHRYGFLKELSITRGRPGLRAHLRFSKGADLRTVSVRVSHAGKVVARGRFRPHGRRGLLGLDLSRKLLHGRYDVTVTAVDRAGVRTTVRRSVRIR